MSNFDPERPYIEQAEAHYNSIKPSDDDIIDRVIQKINDDGLDEMTDEILVTIPQSEDDHHGMEFMVSPLDVDEFLMMGALYDNALKCGRGRFEQNIYRLALAGAKHLRGEASK